MVSGMVAIGVVGTTVDGTMTVSVASCGTVDPPIVASWGERDVVRVVTVVMALIARGCTALTA